MNTDALFFSKSESWSTPIDLFNKLNDEFGFTLDVCADSENTKCERYYTKDDDALLQSWVGICWMNPPYGLQIIAWMKKAHHESAVNGSTVVCLVPVRSDTAWWHDYAMKGDIRFIRGRLYFSESKNAAPFPSAIVIFQPNIP